MKLLCKIMNMECIRRSTCRFLKFYKTQSKLYSFFGLQFEKSNIESDYILRSYGQNRDFIRS